MSSLCLPKNCVCDESDTENTRVNILTRGCRVRRRTRCYKAMLAVLRYAQCLCNKLPTTECKLNFAQVRAHTLFVDTTKFSRSEGYIVAFQVP